MNPIVLAAANEAEHFTIYDPGSISNITGSGAGILQDFDFRRGVSVADPPFGVFPVGLEFVAHDDLWFHMQIRNGTSGGNADGTLYVIRNSADEAVFRFQLLNDNATFEISNDDGASWAPILALGSLNLALMQEYDLNIVLDDTVGIIELFRGGASIARFDGDTTMGNTISDMGSIIWTNAVNFALGEVILAECIVVRDAPSLGMRVATLPVASFGTENDFTGVVGDISPAEINDGTNITSATAGDRVAFTLDNPSATAGVLNVVAVAVAVRSRAGTGAPQTLNFGIKDPTGESLLGVAAQTLSLVNYQVIMNTNNPIDGMLWGTLNDTIGTEILLETAP